MHYLCCLAAFLLLLPCITVNAAPTDDNVHHALDHGPASA